MAELKTTSTLTRPRPTAAASKRQPTTRYKFNTRLAVTTVVVLVILAPSLYAWHAFQVGRNSTALLHQAGRYEQEENWSRAAEFVHRYLQLRPNDANARIRVAKDFDEGARTYREKSRAAQLYAFAIGSAPDRVEPRQRQMALRLELGDYTVALEVAEELLKLKMDHDDPAAVRAKAAALRAKALAIGQRMQAQDDKSANKEAIDAFRTAIEKNPDDDKLARGLAILYRNADMKADADRVMDDLVDRGANKARAKLARWLYRRWLKENKAKFPNDIPDGKLPGEWDEDLLDSLEAATVRAKALAIGRLMQEQGEGLAHKDESANKEAIDAFKIAIEKNPDDDKLAIGLAMLYRKAGEKADADKAMDDLVDRGANKARAKRARWKYWNWLKKEFPNDSDTLPDGWEQDLDDSLVALLEDDHEYDSYIVLTQAGRSALEAKQWDKAIERFNWAKDAEPNDVRVHLELGRAYELQAKALSNEINSNRADEEQIKKEIDDAETEAIVAWEKGLEVADRHDVERQAELQTQIARARVRMQQWEKAETAVDKLGERLNQIFGPAHGEYMFQWCSLKADVALLGQARPADAVSCLHEAESLIRGGGASIPRLADVKARLGNCYTALKQWDQAAMAYKQAADLVKSSSTLWWSVANTSENAGLIDQAAAAYQQYIESRPKPPYLDGAYLGLARVELRRQQESASPNWKAFIDALDYAKNKEELRHSPALKLMDAEYTLVGEKKKELGLAKLAKLDKEALSDRDLVRDVAPKLIDLYERADEPKAAEEFVGALCERYPDSSSALLLFADFHLRHKQPEKAVEHLTEAMAKLTGGARRDVLLSLARAHLAAADAAKVEQRFAEQAEENAMAEQGFAELAKENKEQEINDVRPVQHLAELALNAAQSALPKGNDPANELKQAEALRKLEKVEVFEKELKRMEGWPTDAKGELLAIDGVRRGDGTSWRFYQAHRLVLETLAGEGKLSPAERGRLLRAAESLQREIEQLRPSWPPGFTLKANLAQYEKNDDEAINAYKQAIKLGDTSVTTYDSLIRLLWRQSRDDEAAPYMERLRRAVDLPSQSVPLAIMLHASQGASGLNRAVTLARTELDKDPNDAQMQLRLGYLLSLDSTKQAESQQALGRAGELASGDVRILSRLFNLYVNAHDFEKAKDILAKVKDAPDLADVDRMILLARGYTALKDWEKATECYYKAIELAKGRVDILEQAAAYFTDRDPAQAEKCLRELAGGNDPASHRASILLLIRRGGSKNRKEAQTLLEDLVANPKVVTPTDRLYLAIIYEAQRDMTAAREQMQRLINSANPTTTHLAAYVDFQLRARSPSEATERLEKLASREPESANFRTLALRVRWLKGQKRDHEIMGYVEKHVAAQTFPDMTDAEHAKLLVHFADLLASLELESLNTQVRDYFDQAIQLDTKTHPALATWLIKQHKAPEALELCLKLAETDDSPLSATSIYTVLALSKPGEIDRDRAVEAESVGRSVMARFPDNADLIFAASTWDLMEGDNDEAIRLLDKVLEKQPDHRPALNNLAMLLVERRDRRDEAIETIDRAIDLAGMVPELLDTKGWILLRLALADGNARDEQRLVEAQEMFEEATMLPPGDPRHWFHLALVYELQSKRLKAQKAWLQVGNRGFDKTALIPRERDAWDNLTRALDEK
jgi:tetratricopeptide (TPR) repeat protein